MLLRRSGSDTEDLYGAMTELFLIPKASLTDRSPLGFTATPPW
jgi:hypothetical protein